MKLWERPLLLFSLALNVGFVSLAAVHHRPRGDDLPPAMGGPHDLPMAREWRAHRRALLGHVLDLDADQQRRLDSGFDLLQPQLRTARMQVADRRLAYMQALVHHDADAARAGAAALSGAQARVDSLCAEAMLQETSDLRPEQRARYVHWVFRRGPGRGLVPGLGTGRPGGLLPDRSPPPPPPDADTSPDS